MGRRAANGGVRASRGIIEVRFTWKGRELRPTLPLKATTPHLKHAARLRTEILAEIKAGTFDIKKYFPDYKYADAHGGGSGGGSPTLAHWAAEWKVIVRPELEPSTLTTYYNHLNRNFLSVWGDRPIGSITETMIRKRLGELMDENRKDGKPLSRKTRNNVLTALRGVYKVACVDTPTLVDPTAGIKFLKDITPPPDPFTAEEVEILLAELRRGNDPEMADYFEFACFAGLRPSEQIALRWKNVDLRTMVVHVCEARVVRKTKARTKTFVARDVELNDRAAAVITRQRARSQLAGEQVFLNRYGQDWNDGESQRQIWERVQRRCGIRYRPPKECRDTSVTLALAAGADTRWVAEQHGHSVQTLEKHYAKWIVGADGGRNLRMINAALGTCQKTGVAAAESAAE